MILFQRVFKVHISRIQSMLLVAGMVLWCLLLSLLVVVGPLLASPVLIAENLPDLASLEARLEASLVTQPPLVEILPDPGEQVRSHPLHLLCCLASSS